MGATDRLREWLEKSEPGLEGCLVRFVAVNSGGSMRVLRAHARFLSRLDPDVVKPSVPLLDYGVFVLGAVSLDVAGAKTLIDETATKGGEVAVDGRVFPIGPFTGEGWPPFQRDNERVTPIGNLARLSWPSRQFILDYAARGTKSSDGTDVPQLSYPRAPILRAGLPPIIDVPTRVDSYLQLDYSNQGWGWQNLLAVTVPNYRARIARVKIGETEVEARIESGTKPVTETLCQVTAGLAGSEDECRVVSSGDTISARLPSEFVTRLNVFLIDPVDSELIDWLEFDSERGYRPPQIEFASGRLEMDTLLDSGEGPNLEWKGDVGENAAIGEFFETVTAFANSDGGTILVGVDDNGDILKIDVERSKARIIEFMESRMEPRVEGVEYQIVELEDRRVLFMHVPKGSNPPYLLRRDGSLLGRSEIYVRRGDKDRPARRAEIDAMYVAKQPPQV